MGCTRFRMKALLGVSLLVAVAHHGCRKRSFHSGVRQTALTPQPAPSLGVHDVSILLPLPESEADFAALPSLDLPAVRGKLLSDDEFAQITKTVAYDDSETGLKHRSGIILSGTRNTNVRTSSTRGRLKMGEFDFGKRELWRVMGVRLHPCAPTPEHNKANESPVVARRRFDASACSAQLRLVVQPLVPFPIDEEDMDLPRYDELRKTWKAADYAMHLVYVLTLEEAKALAADLLKFKQGCPGWASDLPLGVHPCLLQEVQNGNSREKFAAVKSLIAKHAKLLGGAAFMGTSLNVDPWIFFKGEFKDGKYEHSVIPAIHVDPVASNQIKKQLLPFNNGYYQMVTFLMANGVMGKEDPSDANQPVVPLPNAKVVPSLAKHIRFEHQQSFTLNQHERFVSLSVDAQQVLNPDTHDTFNTDCVGCHAASRLASYTPKRIALMAARPRDEVQKLYDAAVQKTKPFEAPREFPNIVSPAAVTANKYDVLNFGYFHHFASVSNRTLNESKVAARIANVDFLGLQEPKGEHAGLICNETQLEDCIADENLFSRGQSFTSRRYENLARSAYEKCRAVACKGEMVPTTRFGKATVTFLKDDTVTTVPPEQVNNPEFQRCDIKAGFSMEFDEALIADWAEGIRVHAPTFEHRMRPQGCISFYWGAWVYVRKASVKVEKKP